MGEDAEDCANSVSELRQKLIALTGVDIMLNDKEFKSTYKIIQEISKVWDKMADVDKAAVTKLIGGKRNANVVQALISNFEDAQNVVGVALGANGSATKENEEYLDSIAGKMDVLKGKFQDFSEQLIGNELVKLGADALGVITDIATEIAKLPTFITGPAGILIATTELMSIFKAMPAVIKTAFKSLPENFSIAVSNPYVMAIAGATAFIGIIKSVVDYQNREREAAIEAANASAREFSYNTKEYEENLKKLDQLEGRYRELSTGVGKNGENVSLTASEYSEYKAILEQIIDISPSVVHGYNDEREAMVTYRGAIDEAREALENLHAEELKSYFDPKNAQSRWSGWQDESNVAASKLRDERGYLFGEIANKATANMEGEQFVKSRIKLIQTLIDKAVELGDVTEDQARLYKLAVEQAALTPTAESFEAAVRLDADVIEDIVDNSELYIEALRNIKDESGEPIIDENDLRVIAEMFGGLESGVKQVRAPIQNVINDLKTFLESYESTTKEIAKADWAESYYEQLENVLVDEDIWSDYETSQKRAIELYNEVNGLMSSEAVQGIVKMSKSLDGSKEKLAAFNSAVNEFEASQRANGGDDAALGVVLSWITGLSNVSKAAEETVTSLDKVIKRISDSEKVAKQAKSEMESGGGISADTANEMGKALEGDERLSDFLYAENGMLKANLALWEQRNRAKAQSDLALKGAELAKARAELFAAQNEFAQAVSTKQLDAKGIAAAEENIKKLEASVKSLEDTYLVYQAAASSSDEYLLTALFGDVDSVKSKAANLVSALEKVSDGMALTASEITSLESEYPDLLKISGWIGAETPEQQRAAIEAALQKYEDIYQDIIKTTIDTLRTMQKEATPEEQSVFDTIIENLTARFSGKTLADEIQNPIDKTIEGLKKVEEYADILKTAYNGTEFELLQKVYDVFGENAKDIAFDENGNFLAPTKQMLYDILAAELELEGENASLKDSVIAILDAAEKGEDVKSTIDGITDSISKTRSAANIAQKYREEGMSLDIVDDMRNLFGKDADKYFIIEDGKYKGINTALMRLNLFTDAIRKGATSADMEAIAEEWAVMADGSTKAARNIDDLTDAISRYNNVGSLITDLQKNGLNKVDALTQALSIAKEGNIDIGRLVTLDNGEIDVSIEKLQEYQSAILSFENLQNIPGMTEDIAAAIQDYVKRISEAEAASESLSETLSSMSTIQGLLADVRTGSDDFASMYETVSEMATQSGQSIDEFMTMVGDKAVWNESAIIAFGNTYIDKMVEMGQISDVVGEKLRELMDSPELANKAFIDKESAGMDSVISAIKSSVSETGMNTDQIKELEKRYKELADYAPDELFERTTNGIHLNTKALAKYESQYEKLRQDEKAKEVQELTEQYADLTKQLSTAADATEYQNMLDERNKLGKRIESLKVLQSQYSGLTSTYNKWKQAQSMGEEGDMYDDIASNLKNIKELYDKGLIGTNKFRSAVQMMTDQDLSGMSAYNLIDIYDKAYPKMKKYFTDGQTGVKKFLNDVKALGKGWATVDGAGNWTLDFDAEELAKELGVSTEMIEIMGRKLKDFGFDIDITGFGSGLDKYVTNVDEALAAIEEAQRQLDEDLAEGMNVNEYAERAVELEKTREALAGISAEAGDIDIDTMTLDEAKEKIDVLSTAMAVMTENGLDVPVKLVDQYDKLVELLNLPSEQLSPVEVPAMVDTTGMFDNMPKVYDEPITAHAEVDPAGMFDKMPKVYDEPIDATLKVDQTTILDDVEVPVEIPAVLKIDPDASSDSDWQAEWAEKFWDSDWQSEWSEKFWDGVEHEWKDAEPIEVPVETNTTGMFDQMEQVFDEPIEIPVSLSMDSIAQAGNGVDAIIGAAMNANVDVVSINRLSEAYAQLISAMQEASEVDPVNTDAAKTAASNLKSAASEFTTAFTDLGDKVDVANIEIDADTNKALATIAAMAVPESEVVFNPNTNAIDAYKPDDKSAQVIFTADFAKVVNATVPKLKGVIEYQRKIVGSSQALGTAHAAGTAYKNGVGRTKGKGTALVGEVKPEILVRDGQWTTVGNDGAELIEYQDGDIIFNGSQTEELLKKGKITSGGGRGKVIGSGAAYAGGSDTHINGAGKLTTSGKTSGKSKKSKKSSSSSTSTKSSDLFDWIEIAIARVERTIKNLAATATSTFKTLATRLTATNSEITKIYDEIAIQQKGYERYLQEANAVKLSETLKQRVREGAIDINKYDDSTKQLISDYQTWFEKAIACSDAIETLHENLGELYNDRFSNIEKDYDNQLAAIEHRLSMFDKSVSESEYTGAAKPFRQMIDAQAQSIDVLQRKLSGLKTAMTDAVNAGLAEGSETWYEMQAAINSVTESIKDAGIEMSKLYKDIFDDIEERFESQISLIEHTLTTLENLSNESTYTGAVKPFADVIDAQLSKAHTLKVELNTLEQAMADALATGRITDGSAAWYDMQGAINGVKESLQEVNAEIAGVYQEGFNDIKQKFDNVMSLAESAKKSIENENAASEYTGAAKAFDDMIALQRRSVDTLTDELAQLEESMAIALDSGMIQEGSDAWYEMRGDIEAVKQSVQEAGIEISKLYKDRFDEIESRFGNVIAMQDDLSELLDAMSSASEYTGAAKPFADMVDMARRNVAIYSDELERLQARMKEAVDAGAIAEGSDAWYEMRQAINEVKKNIINAGAEMAQAFRDSFDEIASGYSNVSGLIEQELTRLDNIAADSEYSGAMKPFVDMIDAKARSVELLEDELERLQAAMDSALDSGAVAQGSAAWYEMNEAVESVKENIRTAGTEISKLYVDIFDDIESRYGKAVSLLGSVKQYLKTGLQELEASGYLGGADLYEKFAGIEHRNIEAQKKELAELEEALESAIGSGKIAEGSDAWYDMQQAIVDAKNSIHASAVELTNYRNELRKISWDMFDRVQDGIAGITDEAEFLISLMNSSKLFDDKGQPTGTGNAQIGLHAMNYDVYMNQADRYAEEMRRINEELASDAYDTNLIDRRNELLKLQRESILAAEKEKDAIANLVEEGIKLELESLSELIDKYEESLDSARDLYDYQKNIEKQTREIAGLQKQLAAYANDTSEENRSRLQKISVDLSDAMEKLEETQYDRYIADQKKLLDDLYDDYELTLNMRLDDIDLLMNEMIAYSNQNAADIGSTIATECAAVGMTVSDAMTQIWGIANDALSTYGDGIIGQTTNLNAAANTIAEDVSALYRDSTQIATETKGAIDAMATGTTDAIHEMITSQDAGIAGVVSKIDEQFGLAKETDAARHAEAMAAESQRDAEAKARQAIEDQRYQEEKERSERQYAEEKQRVDAMYRDQNAQMDLRAEDVRTAIEDSSATAEQAAQDIRDGIAQDIEQAKASVDGVSTTVANGANGVISAINSANMNAVSYAEAINGQMNALNATIGGISTYLKAIADSKELEVQQTETTPVVVEVEPTPPQVVEPAIPEVEVAVETTSEPSMTSSKKKSSKKKSSKSTSSSNTSSKDTVAGSTSSVAVKVSNAGSQVANATKKISGAATKLGKSVASASGVKSAIKGYSDGGYIADLQKIAYDNGDDMITINTLKKGEGILTAEQAKQFRQLTQGLPQLQVMMDTFKQVDGMRVLSNSAGINGGVNVGSIPVSINIEHVQDYNDFVRQMRGDKTFERMIKTMTIDPLVGKSTLAKNKFYN